MKVHDNDGFNTDPTFVMNKWKQDFESLYNHIDQNEFDDDLYDNILNDKQVYEDNPTETNDMVNSEISYDEVEKLVKKAKNNKALGIDFIPNEVMKHQSVMLALWQMFRSYSATGLTPSIWLKAIINPIPKSSCTDPYPTSLLYRGIILFSNVSGFLNNVIISYCEFMDIFVDEQNGFRRKRSCDHIYTLNGLITKQLNLNQSVFAAFIDMEKIFDHINRHLLMYRWLQYNIDGRMYRAVQNWDQDIESCIRINNMLSEWFTVINGVRQGDTLSPTLFSLFVNELAKEIKSMNVGIKIGDRLINILLYADDMVLVAFAQNVKTKWQLGVKSGDWKWTGQNQK